MVELVWSKAVTYCSAAQVVRLAKGKDPSLEILGVPTGIVDDVNFAADEAAAAPPTEVADDARGAPDKAAASESKRRRIVGKRHSAGHTSASHVVPRGDDADAATATRPATVYCAENGAAPANNAQPATGTPLAEVASAPSCCSPACCS